MGRVKSGWKMFVCVERVMWEALRKKREERSFVTLACWWIQCLLLRVRICVEGMERGVLVVVQSQNFLPPSPGGLFSENPEPGCVYMVWPYPVWRGCVYMVQFSLRPGSQL